MISDFFDRSVLIRYKCVLSVMGKHNDSLISCHPWQCSWFAKVLFLRKNTSRSKMVDFKHSVYVPYTTSRWSWIINVFILYAYSKNKSSLRNYVYWCHLLYGLAILQCICKIVGGIILGFTHNTSSAHILSRAYSCLYNFLSILLKNWMIPK